MYRETRCRHDSNECPNSNGGSALYRSQSEVGGTPSSPGGGINGPPAHYCGKRKYSMVKFGYHLAVPLAKRTGGTANQQGGDGATRNVIALVGLPARGKTYISKKLSRYLNWIGINTRVFNLGEYRRKVAPTYNNANFFSPNNEEGLKLREKVCIEALQDVIRWLKEDDGEVAVFDATNTTRKRRQLLYQTVVNENGFNLFFVESLCDKEDIIDNNIREVKVNSPDYTQCGEAEVVRDFKARIRHYEEMYETLDEALEPMFSFLKIFNAGEKVLVHKHEGHIQSRIVYYLMNVHITHKTIYLTRHGETDFNYGGRLGGDPGLSPRGEEYARHLAKFEQSLPHANLKVWTSWLKRTIDTAKYIDGVQERWKALNEIDSGLFDGLTYAEVKEKFPDDFVARDLDKFTYRYPRGESYEDLVARLEPVIMELERQDTTLVVAHQAVIRCLLGYYLETPEEQLPWLEVPLHTVIKLEPIAYGCKVQYLKFPVNCVSTHRKKPKLPGYLEPCFSKNIPKEENRERPPFTFEDASDLLKHLTIVDKLAGEDGDVEEEEEEVEEEERGKDNVDGGNTSNEAEASNGH